MMRTENSLKRFLHSHGSCGQRSSGGHKDIIRLFLSIAIAFLLQSCISPVHEFQVPKTATPPALKMITPTITQAPGMTVIPLADSYAGPLPSGAITRLGRGTIFDVAISPLSDQFAVAASIGVYMVDMETMDLHWSIETEYPVNCIAFSPDGKTVAISLQTGFIEMRNPILILSARDGKRLQEFEGHMTWVNALAFTPDGSVLISASQDATLAAWDIPSGERLQILGTPYEARDLSMENLAISPDGATIAAGAYTGQVFIWDRITGQKLYSLHGSESLAFSPDGKYLASAACGYLARGSVTIWQGQDAFIVFEREDLNACALSIAYSPDGKQLVSSYSDGTFIVWDAEWGDRLYTHKNEAEPAHYVAFSPDGTRLLTWVWGGEIFIRDTQTWEVMGKIQAHFAEATDLAYSPSMEQLAIAFNDGKVMVWELYHTSEPQIFARNQEGISSIAFSSDGKLLALGAKDQTITIWDSVSGDRQLILEGHLGWVRSLAFSPDDEFLVSGGGGHSVILWDPLSAEPLQSYMAEAPIDEIAFSPDGTTLALGIDGGTIRIFHVASWHELLSMQIDTYGPITLSYSPDGNHLATGATNHSVVIWDTSSGEKLFTLGGDIEAGYGETPVSSVVYSPDGSLLAAGLLDGTILVFSMESHELVHSFKGHTDMITDLSFLSENLYLISASFDGTVVVWQLRPS